MSSNKFSYSKLETYNGCPFKYKLHYEDENKVYVGSIATEFGTAVHEAEESIAKSIQANEPIDYINIKNSFILKTFALEKKYPVDFNVDDGKSGRNYKDKIYEYLNNGVYRLEKFCKAHPTFKIIGIEQKFNFDYDDNHSFNGAIDRVFYDEATGKYLIQDIKTYAVPINNSDLATPMQFVVYTLAAKDLWGCDESDVVCQYDLPLCNVYQDCCTSGYMIRGVKKILKLFEGIDNKEFAPKQSALCHWCNFCKTNDNAPEPYKFMCPYYCHWTKENKTFAKENEWQGLDKHEIILESYKAKNNIV